MYEELIKSLHICAGKDNCIGCSQRLVESGACIGVLQSQAANAIEELTAKLSAERWIKFETRELTDEEREDNPPWDDILVGPLPDDGERILVNVKYPGSASVQMDEFYSDPDGCYLDSGYEICSEVTHWMPLPKPPKEDN